MQQTVTALPSRTAEQEDQALVRVFAAYTISATAWLIFSTFVGILLAYKFGAPEFGSGAWLTFGRLRPIHTNATFYGWASIALVGLAYYVAVRSCRTSLYSVRLAWIGLWLFNLAAVAGTIALDLGYNDGNLEYREWPWPIRLIFLAALLVTAWNLVATVARRTTDDIYLSNWYTMGGVLWTCIIAVVAILPWYQYGLGQVSGVRLLHAQRRGHVVHAVGAGYLLLRAAQIAQSSDLFVCARCLRVLDQSGLLPDHRRPSLSIQPASLVAADHGHRLQRGHARAGVGRQRQFPADHARPVSARCASRIRWRSSSSASSAICVGSTQGTLEAFRSLQAVWHLTNFTVGHSHLTMYGFVTFAIWGGIYALLPAATGKYPSQVGLALHFWMALVGSFIYVISLSIGGTIQGLDWMQ